MLRATLKSLLAHKLRLGMSAFAIVLGVAFVAGSFVFTDTLERSFSDIFRNTSPDVVVRPVQAASLVDGGFAGADARTVPAATVRELEGVDGVARVDGNVGDEQTFVLDKADKVIGPGQGTPGIAANWNTAPAASGDPVVTLTQGREPRTGDELVLDEKTAATGGYAIGDTVRLVTAGAEPNFSAELVGLAKFGDTGNLVGATLTILDTRTTQQLYLGGTDAYTDVAVTAADGVSNDALRDAVSSVLPDGLEAKTAAQVSDEAASALQQGLGFINTFLLVFAAVALVVGTFLIVNTFSIIVAQRTRELALLRALGASRRQVTRSVLVEAFVVAVVGSTVGLLLGFLLAQGLKALFGAIGLDLGAAGLVFQPRTLVAAYAVGLVVTLLAAYLPARRASRVPPIAALRDDVALPESSMRRRLAVGLVLTVGGAVAMAMTLVGGSSISWLGLGVLAVLVGVALLSPVLGRPVVGAIGSAYPPLFGAVGRLARENAKRNPRRTAATASALMIGLTLVSAMAVLGQSSKSSVDELIASDLRADYVVSNVAQQPFSATVGERIADLDGVGTAAAYRFVSAKVAGGTEFIGSFDAAGLGPLVNLQTASGDVAALGDGTVIVEEGRARDSGWALGDTVEVSLPKGVQELEVVGTYQQNALVGVPLVVAPETLAAGGVRPADSFVYVQRTADADPAAVRSGIEGVIADLPTVTLKDQAAFAEEQRAPIDQLLAVIYALLGLAIVIAVLGIVNTLALSVIERTREIGLLRAVGVSRRQLRRMVRLESVAIAVLGAVLGVVLGVVFGVSLVRALEDDGIGVLAIPYGQLIGFVVVAGLVGVLAAVWPARRAAKMDVLTAIATE